MKKKRLSIEISILSIMLILLSAFLLLRKELSNDLFFDLKTGKDILKHGIDFKDHFSFISNLKYLYHHWLYDLIVFGLYNIGKWNAIFILFLITYSAFGISLFYINKKNSNKLIATIIAIFTMYITAQFFQFRVQSITYLLFLWEIYSIEKLYKTGKKHYSFYLLLISILIVNLHMPLWIFSIILYLPYLTETLLCLIAKKLKKLNNIFTLEKPKNTKIILITFFILAFTGLCSPLKLNPYTFFAKSLFNNSFNIISEMHKTVLYSEKFTILILIIIICGIYFKYLKLTTRDFFLLIGLFLFSLIAIRNIVYFLIFAPTILMKSFKKPKKTNFNKITATKFYIKIKHWIKRINYTILLDIVTLFLICGYSIILVGFFKNKPDYGEHILFPDKSIKFIKNNCNYKKAHIFTDFDFGAYVAFHNLPIFVDSRAEVYIKEFNGGKDIISDIKNIEYYDKYKEVLDKYKFDYLIVYYNTNLDLYLKKDKDYNLLYTEMDGVMFSVYEKTT